MTLSIRPVRAIGEYAACEEIQIEAWQMPDAREVVPLHMLVAAQKSGGLLLGAFDGDEVIGFVLGLASLSDTGRPQHYSHMLAVRPSCQDQGIGWQLKVAQREAVLAQGLDCIVWTYDPLESRNAHLNVARLGVVCRTYERDLYGAMTDGLNVGLPSDRFKVEWPICSERVARRLAGARDEVAPGAAQALATRRTAAGWRAPGQAVLDHDAASVEVEIPADYQAIKAADPELALAWRLATRQILEGYFRRGYTVVEFASRVQDRERRSTYVMTRLGSPA
ncbi:MAG: GNAT family N-acetyltransferase [Anaerolineae bacterium]|nr:GNAT family N-acetyltransferase [Anaerolineae bacterium]